MPKSNNVPTKHTVAFVYRDNQISFNFWCAGSTPDTVLFLGTGQVGKIPKWTAESAPAGLVVVEGLPHWQSDPSADDLVDFSHTYAEAAYAAVLKVFNLASMHVIGESQAAPSTIWLANHSLERVNNIVLLLPMGLNVSSFGDTDEARFKELRKRAIQTAFQLQQSPFKSLRNVYVAGLLVKIILSGRRDGSTVKKYTTGISLDMLEEFRILLAKRKEDTHSVALLLGAQDKIFSAHEIERSLKKASVEDVDMIIAPRQSHSSPVTRSGRDLVARAMEIVRRPQKP